MLNFAIIDDEPNSIANLSHTLESIFITHNYDANICFETTNIDDLFHYLDNNSIDVLFLDIDLRSNLSGLEIAEKVRKTNKNCYFIFVTAYTEYGLDAYKYKTFDFISKPFNYSRLEECIIRLFDDVHNLPRKFIKLEHKNTIIDECQIKYIRRDGMKLIFHTDSRDYEVYSSFTKIQDKLPPNFVRCHKSFIANINNITKIEPLTNMVYFNDSFCDIGPKYKHEFMEVIKNNGLSN